MELLPIDMDSLNLNHLLEADSESAHAGVDLEYDPLFGEMERVAKGKEERQVGDDLVAAEEPDWPKLKRLATDVLQRSKDLRAAMQLTRAMIRTDGYAGLASGLALIRGYIDTYRDTLHPQLDPDDEYDPTIRINTLLNFEYKENNRHHPCISRLKTGAWVCLKLPSIRPQTYSTPWISD